MFFPFAEMVCDNEESSSSGIPSVVETSLEEENVDPQRPTLGVGVGYVSPTIVTTGLAGTMYKPKKDYQELDMAKNSNSSDFPSSNVDTLPNKVSSSTTESISTSSANTGVVDTVTKSSVQSSTTVIIIFHILRQSAFA